MMTQALLTQDTFLIVAFAVTLTFLNVLVSLGLYGRLNKSIAKTHVQTEQTVGCAVNTLRNEIKSISTRQLKEEHVKVEPVVRPAQKSFEEAIALAELGVSSENIARETGLSAIDISAIVRFHSKKSPDPANPLT
ncbi:MULTISPECIES: hypothetical protein [Roseobacteraceae]|uniref:hypothetical protein n=1 Tax=Roseobacteraceae TaxID=2854170 RepID=UPI000782D8A3|nr:hypothetical protein [Celeribacter marinus]